MKLIAAADSNWAIGFKGELLVRIPKDQKTFREMTTGKVVVLGRKTLKTLPQGLPLKERTNIILSRDKSLAVKGAQVVHSTEELMEAVKKYDPDDVYVIGGESIYRQLLPYCDTAHITRIGHSYEADAFLPDLDKDPEWTVAEESDEETYFDLEYRFVRYERK